MKPYYLYDTKGEAIEAFRKYVSGITPDSNGVFFFDKDSKFSPFWRYVLYGSKYPEARWIVYWDKFKKLWTIQTVPTYPETLLEFPKENSLFPLEGKDGVVFVHPVGIIAKVKDWRSTIASLLD
jgi:hypothetical protein